MTTDWIDVLRGACAASSQRKIALQLGYDHAVIGRVLAGTYRGSLDQVRAAVERHLLADTIECPVLGAISRARCLAQQRKPFSAANPTAVQIYRACRSGCAHSLLQPSVPGSAAQPAVASNTGSPSVVPPTAATRTSSNGVIEPTDRRKRSLPVARAHA